MWAHLFKAWPLSYLCTVSFGKLPHCPSDLSLPQHIHRHTGRVRQPPQDGALPPHVCNGVGSRNSRERGRGR